MKREEEHYVERLVSLTVDVDGAFVIVENVPALVSEETGERFFRPETVERLQQVARDTARPERVVQTPVFNFAA